MDLEKERNEIKMQTWISERMDSDIKEIKNKRGMSQAQVTRMLLDIGLEVHRDLSNIGIVRLVDVVYRLKSALKNIALEVAEEESDRVKT